MGRDGRSKEIKQLISTHTFIHTLTKHLSHQTYNGSTIFLLNQTIEQLLPILKCIFLHSFTYITHSLYYQPIFIHSLLLHPISTVVNHILFLPSHFFFIFPSLFSPDCSPSLFSFSTYLQCTTGTLTPSYPYTSIWINSTVNCTGQRNIVRLLMYVIKSKQPQLHKITVK